MIVLKSSGDHTWPWSNTGDDAEDTFARTYAGIHGHMKPLQERLMKRQDKGRFWWELRSCDYYKKFEQPKIAHTDIMWRPQFAFSKDATYLLNTAYVFPTTDLYLLAVLNSPLLWAFMWRNAQHGKDEALRIIRSFSETLPIAEPTPVIRTEVEQQVSEALELTGAAQTVSRELLEWLRIELGIEKPGQRLAEYRSLTADDFATEIRKRRPKGARGLSPQDLSRLSEVHQEYAGPANARAARLRKLELRIAELVNKAYRLTAEDLELLRRTAPPRTPAI